MSAGSSSTAAPDKGDVLTMRFKALLGLLAFVVVMFGAITVNRADGAADGHRRTDAGVYFRAAWAMRTGADPYTITDDNGWHYIYPPALAVLAAPFADPPRAQTAREAGLPYPVSLAIWYVLSLAALALGAHLLASAIEATGESPALHAPPRFGRRWWSLRLLPFLVCIFQIGNTLGRGQVNLFVMLFVCGLAAAIARKRDGSAGAWLGAAITLKIYPAYLLVYPAWRLKWRTLAGCTVGLAVGLVAIPVAAIGAERTLACYRSLYHYLLAPTLGGATRGVNRGEYLDEVTGNVLSFKIELFRLLHPFRATRPAAIPHVYALVHYALCAVVTAITLWAAGWRRRPADPLGEVLFIGALTTALLPMIPVSRDHYFALSFPLVMALVAVVRERHGPLGMPRGWVAFFWGVSLLTIVWELPALGFLKDFQPVFYAEMLLWGAGVRELRRRRLAGAQAAHQTASAVLA
ncbi:MAG: glycosyltransferase family 87 protein [Caulobacterales bacterium]